MSKSLREDTFVLVGQTAVGHIQMRQRWRVIYYTQTTCQHSWQQLATFYV